MFSLDVLSRCSLLDLRLLVEIWVGLGSSDTGMGRSIAQVRTHKLDVIFVGMACQTTARAFASLAFHSSVEMASPVSWETLRRLAAGPCSLTVEGVVLPAALAKPRCCLLRGFALRAFALRRGCPAEASA